MRLPAVLGQLIPSPYWEDTWVSRHYFSTTVISKGDCSIATGEMTGASEPQ
jgi:hypothetical protein